MSDGSAASTGRTALRVVAVLLLLLVVAPFVVTGVPWVVGAEESFVVLSGSMNAEPEPLIQPGDVVIVADVDPQDVEEQDIITFTTGGEEPVTHRVVNVTEQDGQVAFRTKGDANEDADPQLIGPDQIVGEVIVVIPLIGHVVNFANTTQGFVLLVLLPIGLLVLSEVWNLVASTGGSPDETDAADEGPAQTPPASAAGVTADAEAGAVPDEDGGDGPSTVSLGRAQVGWVAIGLVPVVAAAGYTAFRLQSAWIITVFYASIGLLILSSLLYLRIRWGGSGSTEPAGATRSTGSAAAAGGQPMGDAAYTDQGERSTALTTVEEGVHRNPIVTGRIENAVGDGSHVEVSVDSRETLVQMALEKGAWVVNDTESGMYALVDDGVVFQYDDGTGAAKPTSNWEEERSEWVTFSDVEDPRERINGSNGSEWHGDVDRTTTERTTEPAEPEELDPRNLDTTTTPKHGEAAEASDTERASNPSQSVTGSGSEDGNEDERDAGIVPAIRRVDDTDSSEDAVDGERTSSTQYPSPRSNRDEGGSRSDTHSRGDT